MWMRYLCFWRHNGATSVKGLYLRPDPSSQAKPVMKVPAKLARVVLLSTGCSALATVSGSNH